MRYQMRHQSGATLLEVLLAILIMSFGLLSLGVLTASGKTYVKMAQFQSISVSAANELGDLMRANATGYQQGDYQKQSTYSTAKIPELPCTGTPCTAKERASIDLAEWANSLKDRLPGSDAYIEKDLVNPLATNIWIIWMDPDLRGTGSSGLSVQGANDCPAKALNSTGAAQPPRCIFYRISV